MFRTFLIGVGACLASAALAQKPIAPASAPPITRQAELENSNKQLYVLGSEDQISLWALGVEELGDKPYRIDFQGYLDLPLVGRIKAAGLTIDQLKAELVSRLMKEVRKPEVTINMVEFRSQPVSVVGAVNTPGLLQLQGHKTIMEMLSMAGGLRNDSGYSLVITRRAEWGPIPLPGATQNKTDQFSVAEIKLKDLMDASHPEENVAVFPNDVITVPRAQLYYVLGNVKKAGGFVMGEKKSISVLQALSSAEGLGVAAASKNAKILRMVDGDKERVESRIDLNKILEGKAEDLQLYANDILFIPTSTAKKIGTKTIETGLSLGTGILIWR